MNTLHSGLALALTIPFVSTLSASASAVEPLLEYRSKSDVTLPPPSERKVLGTWKIASATSTTECTRSFEQVVAKVYNVMRCSDGSGGKDGTLLTRSSATKFLSTTRAGDYYVILTNGDLSVRDQQGQVDVLPRIFNHSGNQIEVSAPTARTSRTTTPAPTSRNEDRKTAGLDCFAVGYRFGYTGTRAANGKSTNPAWDFVTPDRCKSDTETTRGIHAGTKAAW